MVALSVPVIVLVFTAGLVRRAVGWWRDNPIVRRAGDRCRASSLHWQARNLLATRNRPTPNEFAELVRDALDIAPHRPNRQLVNRLLASARTLYEAEGFAADPPTLPWDATELDAARYRDSLIELCAKLSNPRAPALAQETLMGAFAEFCRVLPPLARESGDRRPLLDAVVGLTPVVRLMDVLTDLPEAVEAVVRPFYSPPVITGGLFAGLRQQLARNQHRMSGVPYTARNFGSPSLIDPSDYDGTPEEVVQGYLRDTPLESLFTADIPFEIPGPARFEHHWIVAGSGHGKTQTLQYFIGRDLERVIAGAASVVVIDSQGDLIKTIVALKQFAPGGPLHDRLCLVDPTDIEYPVALNLFDAGLERLRQYNPLDRERLMNGVLELYDFVLGSLLSAELTQKQAVIFRYITRLMLHIPGATIHTFRELMEPRGYEKYAPHIAKLEGTARAFFETEFNSKQFEDTKRQVVRRLWGILENRTFERMFSHAKNKLDLFGEMNSGKVILINTAKELLKQNGTEIFGRFFIALIAQAAQERATLPREARKPTFVYIDECADYLDENVSLILEQARKFNVGIVLAHQYVGQLSPRLQESFAANTSIKFAGGVSDRDARTFSHMLRCTPEFIYGQPKGHFAAAVRNFTSSAVSLGVPFGYLEAMPKMTAEEWESVRSAMRARYAVHWKEIGHASSAENLDDGAVDSASAAEW